MLVYSPAECNVFVMLYRFLWCRWGTRKMVSSGGGVVQDSVFTSNYCWPTVIIIHTVPLRSTARRKSISFYCGRLCMNQLLLLCVLLCITWHVQTLTLLGGVFHKKISVLNNSNIYIYTAVFIYIYITLYSLYINRLSLSLPSYRCTNSTNPTQFSASLSLTQNQSTPPHHIIWYYPEWQLPSHAALIFHSPPLSKITKYYLAREAPKNWKTHPEKIVYHTLYPRNTKKDNNNSVRGRRHSKE